MFQNYSSNYINHQIISDRVSSKALIVQKVGIEIDNFCFLKFGNHTFDIVAPSIHCEPCPSHVKLSSSTCSSELSSHWIFYKCLGFPKHMDYRISLRGCGDR